ncbi:MAG: divisome protein SepX/GlpR [Sciscionella sp.]
MIIGALVVAWLVVLVPMVARKRQEVARTTDSALAARVVRSGTARRGTEEGRAMADTDDELVDDYARASAVDEDGFDAYGFDTYGFDEDQCTEELPLPDDGYYERSHAVDYAERPARPYRPGRGGYNPEAAELTKQVRYAFRRRVVLGMVVAAALTALAAATVFTALWWAHVVVDLSLAGYLVYLRRQVRIEEEIRQRRLARMRGVRREQALTYAREERPPDDEPLERPVQRRRSVSPPKPMQGAAVVDPDDGDPAFDELEEPGALPYRRASGE